LHQYSYASLSKRVVSFIIDDLVVSLLFIAIFYEQLSTLSSPDAIINFIVQYTWGLILLKILYHTFLISYSGATVGKYFVKIKAINEVTEDYLSWQNAFLRAIVREIGESLLYFTFIFAFFDNKNQTLHDKISKCVVVNA